MGSVGYVQRRCLPPTSRKKTMRQSTITAFLDSLADRTPAPGGGATAALHLGQAAALVSMVARYSTGPRYAEHAAVIDGICRSSTPTGCQSPPKARQPNVIGSSELRTQTSPDLPSLPPDTGEHAIVRSLPWVLVLRCASSHFTRRSVELADSHVRERGRRCRDLIRSARMRGDDVEQAFRSTSKPG